MDMRFIKQKNFRKCKIYNFSKLVDVLLFLKEKKWIRCFKMNQETLNFWNKLVFQD